MKSSERRPETNHAPAAKNHNSLRCFCGSLLARLVPDGVELKCRRCKRQVVVPLQGKTGGASAI